MEVDFKFSKVFFQFQPRYWKSRENFDVQKFHSLAILTPKYVQHGNKSIYKILHEFNFCVAGGRQRFHVSNNTGIFSTTSTLLPMPIVEWYFRGIQTFPECYSRFSQCYSTIIFALHALSVYFQVKFSHTRSNSFWKMPKFKRSLIYRLDTFQDFLSAIYHSTDSFISTMVNGTHFWSVIKVALRFGCAKQSKNLECIY